MLKAVDLIIQPDLWTLLRKIDKVRTCMLLRSFNCTQALTKDVRDGKSTCEECLKNMLHAADKARWDREPVSAGTWIRNLAPGHWRHIHAE